MFQITPRTRKPSLALVLASGGLTLVWWAGLCALSGRTIWFW